MGDASAGDTVLIQQGHTYQGSFTLPRHGGSEYVTVRTGVNSTGSVISTSGFPAENVRMTGAMAESLQLAKFQATTNNGVALRTADPSGGNAPEYWHLKWIQFGQNASTDVMGSGALFQCGSDSASTQTLMSEIASNVILEQVYAAGDPFSGQFRGLAIHCNDATVRDSTVEHIKTIAGTEGQAVYWNSASGLTLINNYFSGGTEVFLSAGSGGCCRNTVTVESSPSPTTTTATISSRDGLRVGHGVTFEVSGSQFYTEITSCGTSTPDAFCTSNNVEFSPALSSAPDTPGRIRWGHINYDLTVQKNVFTRPLTMRSDILGAPQSVNAAADTGGTLASGTYSYRVVARAKVASNGSTNMARSAASAEVSTTTGNNGSVTITWAAVSNATQYYIYGRSAGGQNVRWSVTTSACSGSPSMCSFTDDGSSGTSENVPTSAGTKFSVKNTFELKNTDGALVEGNIMEHSWSDAQVGYLVLFTPTSASGANPSSRVRDVTFRHNIVRHGAGGFQWTGRSTSSQPTGQSQGLYLTQNLFYDINSSWGSSVHWMLISTSANAMYGDASIGPADLVVEHNTIDKTSGALLVLDLNKSSVDRPVEGVVWRNNLSRKASTGLTGGNSCIQGSGCWERYTTGTVVWDQNVVSGATCSVYPTGTICPSDATLTAQWQDPTNANYKLVTSSAYRNAGTDGQDLGVSEWSTLDGLIAIAVSGDNTGAEPDVPPSLTTTSLASVQAGQSYQASIVGVCPNTPCTFSAEGLPSGLSIATVNSTQATISGTPTIAGTYTVTVTITSAVPLTGSRQYQLQVTAPPPTGGDDPGGTVVDGRPARINLSEGVHFRGEIDPSERQPKEPGRVGDIWADTGCGPEPALKLLTQTGPTFAWRAVKARESATASTVGSAANATYTATQLVGGLILRNPNGADRDDVTPTATEILALIPCPVVGDTFEVDIRNIGADGVTVTAGSGVELVGPMAVAAGTTRRFRAIVTAVETPAVHLYGLMADGDPGEGGGAGSPAYQAVSVTMNASTVNFTAGSEGAFAEIVGTGRRRVKVDAQFYTTVGFTVQHQHANLSPVTMKLQYWSGSAWEDAGPSVTLSDSSDSLIESTFTSLATGAREAGTIFRMVAAHSSTPSAATINNVVLIFRP